MATHRSLTRLWVLVGLLAVLTVAASPASAVDYTKWQWDKTTGELDKPRIGYAATRLTDGKVLVTGGIYPTGTLGTVTLYDTITETQVFDFNDNQQWVNGPDLTTPRFAHTATLLTQGTHASQVLIVGGATLESDKVNHDSTKNCELLNPDGSPAANVPDLPAARENHTATELLNGDVLVVGGQTVVKTTGPYLNTSELYTGGSWKEENLKYTHSGHTATRLQDGRVLVVGGFGGDFGTGYPAKVNCEIYDPNQPVGKRWREVDKLKEARGWHSATLLPDGRVLVTGGTDKGYGGTPKNTYEVFTPPQSSTGKGTWTKGKDTLREPRFAHEAVLLGDGTPDGGNNVLVIGGAVPGNAQTSEMYQPDKDSWDYVQYGLNYPRIPNPIFGDHFTAIRLDKNDDRILVAGGGQVGGDLFEPSPANAVSLGEVPANEKWVWDKKNAIKDIRCNGHTATLITQNVGGLGVLVAGGFLDQWGQKKSYPTKSTIYDVSNDTWVGDKELGILGYHTASNLADDRVMVAGGITITISPIGIGTTPACKVYDPKHPDLGWQKFPDLPQGRALQTATVLDASSGTVNAGGILACGGLFANLSPTTGKIAWEAFADSTYLYNQGSWKPISDSGQNPSARGFHTATYLPDGKVLIAGGFTYDSQNKQFTPLDSCYIYNNGQWQVTGHLKTARGFHTATLLPGSTSNAYKVLVAGGQTSDPTGGATGSLQTYEIYDSTTGQWTTPDLDQYPGKHLQLPRTQHTASLLTDGPYKGKVLLAGCFYACEIYDPKTDEWRILPTGLNVLRSGHTTTLLPDGRVFVVGGNAATGVTEMFEKKQNTLAGLGSTLSTNITTKIQAGIQKLLQSLPTGGNLIKIGNIFKK